jgi:hypothetical protein
VHLYVPLDTSLPAGTGFAITHPSVVVGWDRVSHTPPCETLQQPGRVESSPSLGETHRPVRLYGLIDCRLNAERPLEQVIELYGNRKDAEEALRRVLRDEPSRAGALEVLELPLVECPTASFSFN